MPKIKIDQNNIELAVNSYHDMTIPFALEVGQEYFILRVDYESGDSHGSSNEHEYVGVYKDCKVALENRKRIIAQANNFKNKMYECDEDAFTFLSINDDGKEFKLNTPWNGYFEKILSINIIVTIYGEDLNGI